MRADASLWIELTPNCNLACEYCYNPWRDGGKRAYPSMASYAELEAGVGRLLDRVSFSYVALSGGEPLLYPSLTDLVRFLQSRRERIVLTTNGRSLTSTKLDELCRAGLDEIQVSLLAGRADIHDAIARRASWRGAIRSLVMGIQSGIDVGATFVATSKNLAEMSRVVELLSQLGVKRLVINELQPVGSARGHLTSLAPDHGDFERALHSARAIAAQRDVALTVIRVGGREGSTAQDPWRRWSVSPDGRLKLCNHSTRTLGRLASMADETIDALERDLSGGRAGRYRDRVDNCRCMDMATGQSVG